jgi:hypothetical protein
LEQVTWRRRKENEDKRIGETVEENSENLVSFFKLTTLCENINDDIQESIDQDEEQLLTEHCADLVTQLRAITVRGELYPDST